MNPSSRGALRPWIAVFVFFVVVAVSTHDLAGAASQKIQPSFDAAIASLETAGGGPGRLEIQRSHTSGLVRSVVAAPGASIRVSTANRGAAPRDVALAFAAEHAELFGLRSTMELNVLSEGAPDEVGLQRVRMQQVVDGVPVTGSFLSVHVKGGEVVRAFAGTSALAVTVQTTANVPEQAATHSARELVTKYFKAADAELSKPRLEILDRELLEGRKHGGKPTLAWFVEAWKPTLREYIWIDAKDGRILLHFSQLTDAKSRTVYDAFNTSADPGTLARSEGGPATAVADVNAAYDFAGDTYDYFFTQHGRDSFDGAGAPIRSTVRYCDPSYACPYENAFWNGQAMYYGQGYAAADDVDGHELTHAVTEHSAHLFYYYQSGALNESFSDIFGETIDQTNGAGTDGVAVNWLLGEDVPGLGAIRDMKNPNDFSDPAAMNDQNYWCDSTDNGGVHTNSGVQNKAYQLMVDGGTLNSVTVTGIGLTKAGKIAYRVLTQYLDSGSNFADAYAAWNSSCADLVGTAGITAANCTQVRNALDAVQMNGAIPCPDGAAVPPMCGQGAPSILWQDSFENSSSGLWAQDAGGTSATWNYGGGIYWNGYASDGVQHLLAYAFQNSTPYAYKPGDFSVQMTSSVAIPAGARMQFDHSFEFEPNFDGGWVEYSTNAGGTWLPVPDSMIAGGMPYTDLSVPGVAHPLFGGNSWGYTASQLNLSTLAGQSVRFRFRNFNDSSVGYWGWAVDNVRIYTCVNDDPPTGLVALGSGTPSVALSWNVSSGATSYNVFRKSPGGSLVQIGTSPTNAYNDLAVVANTAYMYTVRAVRASGESPDSNRDVATTIAFTDQPIGAGTVIKLAHLSQARIGVDKVRALAGLPAGVYADAAVAGLKAGAGQVTELRTQLDAALTALGITPSAYIDPALIAGLTVKGMHFQQLWSRMH